MEGKIRFVELGGNKYQVGIDKDGLEWSDFLKAKNK